MEDNQVVVSILLLGDPGCGKSTFLSRLSQGRDSNAPIALLKDINQPFVFEIHNRRAAYRLEFYDTASPTKWELLRPDLVILCYDISQRLSLINLQRLWIKQARVAFQESDSLPILVLGLKRDLRSEDDPNGIIYPQEAYRISQELRADRYMECSAVTGDLLGAVFEDICATAAKTTEDGGGQSAGACVAM